MATSASTLIQRTRRFLRDWPEEDVLTASVSSSATTLTVADGTIYPKNLLLELDQEVLYTSTAGTGTTITDVRRAQRGSTAASHASGASVLINPGYYSVEILDALNDALDACYPLIYRPVATEFSGPDGSTYEWTIPSMSGIAVAIPTIYRIDVQQPGDPAFRQTSSFEIARGESPFIKFSVPVTSGALIRVYGYGPHTHLTAVSDTLDTYFPKQAEGLLPLFAASQLLASGEAGRVRRDTGAIDQRENANQTGSAMRASDGLRNRFYTQLQQAAMSPLPRHVRSVL